MTKKEKEKRIQQKSIKAKDIIKMFQKNENEAHENKKTEKQLSQ